MKARNASIGPSTSMAGPVIRQCFQRSRLADDYLAAAYDAVMAMDPTGMTDAMQAKTMPADLPSEFEGSEASAASNIAASMAKEG
jgi:hypothetical protein